MKALTLALVVILAGCTEQTEYGECVGFGKRQDPALQYEISTHNAVWTALAIQTVWAPVVWALEYAYCPVGRK